MPKPEYVLKNEINKFLWDIKIQITDFRSEDTVLINKKKKTQTRICLGKWKAYNILWLWYTNRLPNPGQKTLNEKNKKTKKKKTKANTRICFGKWNAYKSLWLWHTTRSPNPGQKKNLC